MALTDIKVRTIKPTDKPFKLTDEQGMHLLINPNGSKYWRLQYRFDGKQKVLALGVYPLVTLAEARRKRDEAKKLLFVGIDPSEKKKADKIEQSEALTFEDIAREWHTACKRKWSASHSERVLKSMEDGLFTVIGKKKIAELKTRDFLVPIKAVEASGRLELRLVYSKEHRL
ncbi:putative prophage CPS-53 integrase [Photorhabdus namnaonensis]|uniref:Putative prophage CPS-53 integrase n=1 Tax=Photorhabdus namnaonensis TaxID=1851568 RepID=A0A1B8YBY7_9GAMM|nr:putative prophage CPS-53 integrase [Photorhabdus namnaonensis]